MIKTCIFYITLQCNDTCEFCHLWQNSDDQEIRGSVEQVKQKLKELRIKGVKKLNLTGGEPLLCPDLPEILRNARMLGFQTEMTTNGILYAEKEGEITGLLDQLYFSLDYPIASEHDRSRGVDCYNLVISAIKRSREKGDNPSINFTLTRDNVRFLPEMVELSERLKVPVSLNPVYDYFGTQGFAPATIEHILYYSRKRNVRVNRAALEFIKAGGNQTFLPRCRARDLTVTMLPDLSLVSPCFYNRSGQQGREPICSSCMRWPYMLPSFSVGIDKYFWLNLYSEWSDQLNLRLKSRSR
jgi:MoaA/NifB/PqqE/SkfB family radical SAM enzyme